MSPFSRLILFTADNMSYTMSIMLDVIFLVLGYVLSFTFGCNVSQLSCEY